MPMRLNISVVRIPRRRRDARRRQARSASDESAASRSGPSAASRRAMLIQVLRRRGAGAAAAHPRSRDGDEALSAWRGRRVLLHEARAVAAARWIRTCTIDHGSGNVIDFPVIDDLPSLLWVINLGCIDLESVVRAM